MEVVQTFKASIPSLCWSCGCTIQCSASQRKKDEHVSCSLSFERMLALMESSLSQYLHFFGSADWSSFFFFNQSFPNDCILCAKLNSMLTNDHIKQTKIFRFIRAILIALRRHFHFRCATVS